MRTDPSAPMGLSVAMLLGAVVAAGLAWHTGHLGWKLAVPAGGAVALLIANCRPPSALRAVAPVIVAFGFAAVGDALLSLRAGRTSWFVAGIAAYLVSHLGYVTYALGRGRLHRPTLVISLMAFLAYVLLGLGGRVPSGMLLGAVVVYGGVSCVSLAAAAGLRQPPWSRTLFLAGIGLIFFSDTLISFQEFLHYRTWSGWILPTYYLALVCLTAAVLSRRERQLDL